MTYIYQPVQRPIEDVSRLVGQKITDIRTQRGLSLKELGEAMNPPLLPQKIRRYETGQQAVSAVRLWQIAQILDVPVTAFYPQSLDRDLRELCEKLADAQQDILLRWCESLG